jgi:hypothetical protein
MDRYRHGPRELVITRKHAADSSAQMAKLSSESALTAEEMLMARPGVSTALLAAQLARMFMVTPRRYRDALLF